MGGLTYEFWQITTKLYSPFDHDGDPTTHCHFYCQKSMAHL